MKKLFSFFIFILTVNISFTQVGIGTNTPDNSAILDVTSTDKGVLVPRVSLNDVSDTSGTATIPSPATGLLVWNTNAATTGGSGVGFYFFNGSIWLPLIQQSNTLDQAYDEGGAGAGKDITADAGAVKIEGEDGLFVIGTFGSGATISESGAGSRMFFNPRKAAFRAGFVNGTQWDDANVGDYSFAANRNNIASGEASFAAGEENTASGTNATSFGRNNIANGTTSFTTGAGNIASGENAFASGQSGFSFGDNSFTAGNENTAGSYAEVVMGNFATIPTLSNGDSNSVFYTTDRAFAIGIGVSTASRANALEVWKDGRVIINEEYTLPTTDGTNGQTLVTDGAGNVSWSDPGASSTNLVSHTMYATDTNVTVTSTTTTVVPGTSIAVIPTEYDPIGNLRIKVVISYSALSGTAEFRLRMTDDTATNSVPLSYTVPKTFTAIGTGGVVESDWTNWSAGATSPYEINLQARVSAAGSFTIESVHVLISQQ
jgi:hypothetical protein